MTGLATSIGAGFPLGILGMGVGAVTYLVSFGITYMLH